MSAANSADARRRTEAGDRVEAEPGGERGKRSACAAAASVSMLVPLRGGDRAPNASSSRFAINEIRHEISYLASRRSEQRRRPVGDRFRRSDSRARLCVRAIEAESQRQPPKSDALMHDHPASHVAAQSSTMWSASSRSSYAPIGRAHPAAAWASSRVGVGTDRDVREIEVCVWNENSLQPNDLRLGSRARSRECCECPHRQP